MEALEGFPFQGTERTCCTRIQTGSWLQTTDAWRLKALPPCGNTGNYRCFESVFGGSKMCWIAIFSCVSLPIRVFFE